MGKEATKKKKRLTGIAIIAADLYFQILGLCCYRVNKERNTYLSVIQNNKYQWKLLKMFPWFKIKLLSLSIQKNCPRRRQDFNGLDWMI